MIAQVQRSELPRRTILVGDARARLAALPPASVDSVITSPPYFALRNYGVAGQLGLEASVGEWVADLLAVLEELARVLKPEGTLWLNLGDSFSRRDDQGAPPKGLVLAPERLLLAAAEAGWRVRNKIVWAKPNPLPASVQDRLTCTWEPIYLLTRERRYYFDLDAVRIPHRTSRPKTGNLELRQGPAPWAGPLAGTQNGLAVLKGKGLSGHPLGKNPGDVWTIATRAGWDVHHATFPEAVVRTPLLAGTPESVCAACGQAWQRQRVSRAVGRLAVLGTLAPACTCRAHYRPGVVLDPFMGSGTVAMVAEQHGRDWLGIELSPTFARSAKQRIAAARQDSEENSSNNLRRREVV